MATRLPTVGGDSGTWGDVLNAFLRTEHNIDGTHAGNIVYVNKFYPTGETAPVRTNTSCPLSATYASLAAAQVDYPAATALTDEKDWCAWQAASNFIYTRDDIVLETNNWSAGHIVADGHYVVNKPVVFNHAAILVEGATPGTRLGSVLNSGTTVKYNGTNGTIDAPKSIFDFYLFDEAGAAPAGRKGNTVYTGGTKVEVRNILFYGKEGDMNGSFDASGFISGIRLRKSFFSKIYNCVFGGTLYDGITITDAQLFCDLDRNFFYRVHRDAIQLQAATNFSTTTWIRNNEFGFVGRYAILCDMMGSVEPMPIVQNNSFEHTYESYFVLNPEWFVQGLVASSCFVNCGNLLFEGNRVEAATDVTPKFYADVHLLGCTGVTLQNSIFRNLALTARSAAALRTSAANTYYTANSHYDITNQRNYNCGTAADFNEACVELTIRKIYNLEKILLGDGVGLSTSAGHRIEDIIGSALTILSIPTTAGAFATVVQPRNTALLTLPTNPFANLNLTKAGIVDINGNRRFGTFNQLTGCGDYQVRSGAAAFGTWAANTAYVKTTTGIALDSFRAPLTENGFFYQCIVSGTSHATTEPTWPTTIGNTVVDGTVTWKCVGRVAYAAEDNVTEWQEAGKRNRSQAASPTTGLWAVSDKIIFSAPIAGGYIGAVCVVAGTPGTWKGFGPIAN